MRLSRLQSQSILFVVIVIALFWSKDQVVRYFLKEHEENKTVEAVLEAQNMLSQHITKLALLIQNDIQFDTLATSRPDSLTKLLPRWFNNHRWLVKNNKKHGPSDFTAIQVDSLLALSTPLVDQMYSAGLSMLPPLNKTKVGRAVKIIDRYELQYHHWTQQSVDLYQRESNSNFKFLRDIELVLTLLATLGLLITGYVLVYNILTRLSKQIKSNRTIQNALLIKNEEHQKLTNEYKQLNEELVLAKNKAEESEVFLATVLDYIPHMVFVKTIPDFRFALVNKATEKFRGLPKECFLEDNQGIYSKEEAARVMAQDLHVLETQGIYEYEVELSNRIVAGKKLIIKDKQGLPKYLLGISEDITNRKNIERELIENKTRLSMALRGAGMGVWSWNIPTNHRTFDEQTCNVLGISFETFQGTAEEFLNAIHPDDREFIRENLRRTVEEDAPYAPEFRALWSDGSIHYLSGRGKLEKSADGKPLKIKGIIWDNTERKEVEAKLMHHKELLLEAQSLAHIGNFEANLETGEEFWSEELYNILGLSNHLPAHFDTYINMIHPEDRVRRLINQIDFDSPTHQFKYELRIIRPSGEIRNVLEMAVVKRNVLNKNVIIRGTVQDVTEYKRIEKELLDAKEAAEESNRLKTIFLGSLSHEVRTPLQGILGMTELLELPSISSEKQKEFISIIKRRTNDLQIIIESLLDLASIEAGEIKSFPTDLNLFELVEVIYNRAKQDHFLIEKSVSFILRNQILPSSMVSIDPYHLTQVLTNFISNAVKFTERGEITLTVYKTTDQYIFELTDTGIGIAPDKLEHIFKPFRQAHEGLSRSKGGIGLGLSSCKKMIEMWRGSLKVTSTLGKGSTFQFTVPD
ncbi:MAG: PAS domain-containing protein [Cyclobacteriaceae bacterium]|nr:PAS domain-containing protein [Cyclobacteriaceae bacterium]